MPVTEYPLPTLRDYVGVHRVTVVCRKRGNRISVAGNPYRDLD
jgi:hypothetical protein